MTYISPLILLLATLFTPIKANAAHETEQSLGSQSPERKSDITPLERNDRPYRKRPLLQPLDLYGRQNQEPILDQEIVSSKIIEDIEQEILGLSKLYSNDDPFYLYVRSLLYTTNNTNEINAIKDEAEEGEPNYQLILGLMYQIGVDEEINAPKAVEWWSESAAQGNEWAKSYLKNLLGGITYNPVHPPLLPQIKLLLGQLSQSAHLLQENHILKYS